MRTDFLDYTITVWQPYSRRALAREDARRIVANATRLFDTLARWDAERAANAAITEAA